MHFWTVTARSGAIWTVGVSRRGEPTANQGYAVKRYWDRGSVLRAEGRVAHPQAGCLVGGWFWRSKHSRTFVGAIRISGFLWESRRRKNLP
jgi:hypothetical protein